MTWKQALAEGGTRFAVYVTAGNRHYFSHADGYYWELSDGNLLVRTKLPGKLGRNGWEAVYQDDGLYPDLLRAYTKLVPPNIPEAPLVKGLRALLLEGERLRDSVHELACDLAGSKIEDDGFVSKLDELITTATALRKML